MDDNFNNSNNIDNDECEFCSNNHSDSADITAEDANQTDIFSEKNDFMKEEPENNTESIDNNEFDKSDYYSQQNSEPERQYDTPPVENFSAANHNQSAAPDNPLYSSVPNYVYPGSEGGYDPQIPHMQAERVQNTGNANPYSSSYSYSAHQNFNQPNFSQNVQPNIPSESKKMKKGTRTFLSAIALILVFALGVGTASIFKDSDKIKTDSENEEATSDSVKVNIAESPTSNIKYKSGTVLTASQIAEHVRPSNVGIVVYSGKSTSASGEGSGIVMGPDGTGEYTYIITCAHVINTKGIKCTVQTEDGKKYDADIVGYDTRTDIGVIKVKAKGLKAAEFGDSDALSIGDAVYAVGNPGGVEFFGSFTGGFISAINRPISSEIGYTMKCIQHDASINPGNSGGMLVNQYGQVIGINSQKIASAEYEGMGFAIPITAAKQIIEDLISFSYVPNRPMLGITYFPVTASTQYSMIAQIKGLPAGTLIINEIGSESSLNNTEARKYDMIIKVNGKDLTTADVLLELIDKGKVGDKLTLTLCRVNDDYSLDEFDVEAYLVEDKGTPTEETTTYSYINPFDYFYNFGN